MKIRIIVIGDELLNGQVADTNSGYIARSIAPYGWTIENVEVVHDSYESIVTAVRNGIKNCDVVVTSGGLGPTRDDITKMALLSVFGGELVRNEEVSKTIEEVVRSRGIKLNSLTADQALVPSSCKVLQNHYGTAPVMWFEEGRKTLISLPGVPFELAGCWRDEVLPALKRKYSSHTTLMSRTLIVTGITESDLAIRLGNFEDNLSRSLHLAYLPNRNYIRLRLDGVSTDTQQLKNDFENAYLLLKKNIGDFLLHEGDNTPAEILLRLLNEKGLTIGTAESCTGGMIASSITLVPGASSAFAGGIISYSNEVKKNILHVDEAVLKEKGAVSREVVEQMARETVSVLGCDCSIATSGIAGPTGGSKQKPVGTVWMALGVPGAIESKCFHFTGSRSRIIETASNAAILWLCATLKNIK